MTSLLDEIATLLERAGIEDAAAVAARLLQAAHAASGGDVEGAARAMAERCVAGIPVAYVVGCETFMGLDLIAAEGALAPREETELLGRTAVATLGLCTTAEPRVIDMCCGSGNLACAIAHHVPAARVWASDLTDGCVGLARRNVDHVGVFDRVTVAQGDLFAGLAGFGIEDTIDVVVCNPPYISQGRLATDRSALLRHEPREAFDGGPYGLSIHQRVVREALPFLRPGGVLLFEIGLGQDRQVAALFERTRAYMDVRSVTDAEGRGRVVLGCKRVE